jgi:hypothetical protein
MALQIARPQSDSKAFLSLANAKRGPIRFVLERENQKKLREMHTDISRHGRAKTLEVVDTTMRRTSSNVFRNICVNISMS